MTEWGAPGAYTRRGELIPYYYIPEGLRGNREGTRTVTTSSGEAQNCGAVKRREEACYRQETGVLSRYSIDGEDPKGRKNGDAWSDGAEPEGGRPHWRSPSGPGPPKGPPPRCPGRRERSHPYAP